MSGNNGLFESDDEDDIQYNPDAEEDYQIPQTVTSQAPVPTPAPITAQAPVTAQIPTSNSQEEEKIQSTSYPAPTPATSQLPPAPIPAPVQAHVPVQPHIPAPVPQPTSAETPIPAPTPITTNTTIPIPTPLPVPEVVGDDSVFTVSDPVNTGHVSYTVKGVDEDGEFEGSRRYNDFFHIRNALVNRWPGTFVPAIPSKKAVGNKDDKYIEHRRFFLQRFLKKIGGLPHLLNSDEFKIFSRPSGDIEKILAMLPKMTPSALVERYKSVLHIDEYPDDFLVKQCREVINEFGSFCKKVLPTLKALRETTSKMVPTKAQQNSNYKGLIQSMVKFEEEALSQYCDSNYNKFVVGDPS